MWDERLGVFRVKVQGNRDVGSLVILRSADMPISHLDSTLPHKQTKLGQFLRERLELAVNAAVTRGSHRVGSGPLAAVAGRNPEGLRSLRRSASGASPDFPSGPFS